MTHHSKFTIAAMHAALSAGHFLKSSFDKPHTVHSKEGKKNLVTECDLASEEMIITFLQKQFPDHNFLAEEKGKRNSSSSDYIWIIDPLDGTVNFTYQVPLFAVSIALCKGEEILSGVIFQPMTQELFVAEKGEGAYLNGKRLQVSKETRLEEAFLTTGFPYDLDENPHNCIGTLTSLLRKGIPTRDLGSAALNLAYVAAGRFDGFWEVDLQPWDVAAGSLLVTEAGGRVSSYEGTLKKVQENGSLLATNSLLHADFIQELKKQCNL